MLSSHQLDLCRLDLKVLFMLWILIVSSRIRWPFTAVNDLIRSLSRKVAKIRTSAQMTKVRCCSLRTWAVKTRFWRSWGYFGRHFFRTKFSNYWFVFGAWNKISNTHGKKIRFVCYWKNLYMIYLIRYKCIYKWFGFVFYLFQYFVCIFGMFIYFSFLTCFTLCQQTCDGVS